jgi:hypothetical protein
MANNFITFSPDEIKAINKFCFEMIFIDDPSGNWNRYLRENYNRFHATDEELYYDELLYDGGLV